MSVVRMSFVICDTCGTPAVGNAASIARLAAPKSWRVSRDGDFCPEHRRSVSESDPGPIVFDPPLTQAEHDAYWAAISRDEEPQ